MSMHLLKEKDIKEICPYCKESTGSIEWISEFCGELHYKVGKCKCGKKLRLEVDFIGSGDDLWAKIKDHEWENRKNIAALIAEIGR